MTELDIAALQYAKHESSTIDRGLIDCIMDDFKAGAEWERKNGVSAELLKAVVDNNGYVPVALRKAINDHIR